MHNWNQTSKIIPVLDAYFIDFRSPDGENEVTYLCSGDFLDRLKEQIEDALNES